MPRDPTPFPRPGQRLIEGATTRGQRPDRPHATHREPGLVGQSLLGLCYVVLLLLTFACCLLSVHAAGNTSGGSAAVQSALFVAAAIAGVAGLVLIGFGEAGALEPRARGGLLVAGGVMVGYADGFLLGTVGASTTLQQLEGALLGVVLIGIVPIVRGITMLRSEPRRMRD